MAKKQGPRKKKYPFEIVDLVNFLLTHRYTIIDAF